jgi:hypothetical protein
MKNAKSITKFVFGLIMLGSLGLNALHSHASTMVSPF